MELYDFDEEDETSNLDFETVGQLDGQSRDHLGENCSDENFSTGSLAILEMRDIPWELEIPLSHIRKIIDETIEVGYDGCQEFCHHLRTCKHKTDWKNCRVDIPNLLSPIWQAFNPWS